MTSENLSKELDVLHAKLLAIGADLVRLKKDNMAETDAVKRPKIGLSLFSNFVVVPLHFTKFNIKLQFHFYSLLFSVLCSAITIPVIILPNS